MPSNLRLDGKTSSITICSTKGEELLGLGGGLHCRKPQTLDWQSNCTFAAGTLTLGLLLLNALDSGREQNLVLPADGAKGKRTANTEVQPQLLL
jgi:hypothetical protein